MASVPAILAMTAPGESAREDSAPGLDEHSFERFYGRTTRSLWAYVHRLAGDAAVADDVHQESYLKYLARPCPGPERRQSAYLFRIATNLLRDRWRRQKRERGWLESLLARPAEIGRRDRSVSERVDVLTALDRLEPRQRALLWLAYVEGCSHAEIAEILELRAASIRVLLFRARRKMAAVLEELGLNQTAAPQEESDAD